MKDQQIQNEMTTPIVHGIFSKFPKLANAAPKIGSVLDLVSSQANVQTNFGDQGKVLQKVYGNDTTDQHPIDSLKNKVDTTLNTMKSSKYDLLRKAASAGLMAKTKLQSKPNLSKNINASAKAVWDYSPGSKI